MGPELAGKDILALDIEDDIEVEEVLAAEGLGAELTPRRKKKNNASYFHCGIQYNPL